MKALPFLEAYWNRSDTFDEEVKVIVLAFINGTWEVSVEYESIRSPRLHQYRYEVPVVRVKRQHGTFKLHIPCWNLVEQADKFWHGEIVMLGDQLFDALVPSTGDSYRDARLEVEFWSKHTPGYAWAVSCIKETMQAVHTEPSGFICKPGYQTHDEDFDDSTLDSAACSLGMGSIVIPSVRYGQKYPHFERD